MEWILNGIKSFISSIVDIWLSLYDFIYDFWMTCINVLSYIISIVWFIFYGWKTLIIWIFKLFTYLVNGDLVNYVNSGYINLSQYIWSTWTIFLFCMFFIIVIRILIAVVFKIFRFNIDYKNKGDN